MKFSKKTAVAAAALIASGAACVPGAQAHCVHHRRFCATRIVTRTIVSPAIIGAPMPVAYAPVAPVVYPPPVMFRAPLFGPPVLPAVPFFRPWHHYHHHVFVGVNVW